RVLAFMSDAKPMWARRWLEWPRFERFWGRLLAAAMTGTSDYRTRVDIQTSGEECRVLVSVRDSAGKLPKGIVPAGVLRRDGGDERIDLSWEDLPSGIYRGTCRIVPDARYVCELNFRTTSGKRVLRSQSVVAGAIGAELAATGPDDAALAAIAAAGGGIFTHNAREIGEVLRTPIESAVFGYEPPSPRGGGVGRGPWGRRVSGPRSGGAR